MFIKQPVKYLAILCFGLISCLLLQKAIAHNHIDPVSYKVYRQSTNTVRVVTIPHSSVRTVSVKLAEELQPLTDFAIAHNPIAAINAGYFDPVNGETTSHIVQEGETVADPRTNDRLIDNPDLQPYLSQILNRSEFRRYQCGTDTRYDITSHDAPIMRGCRLADSVGGGPQILPESTSEAEAFTAYEDGELIRNAIGETALNARSAVAMTDKGDILLATVQQITPTDSGMSLEELAEFLKQLGATKALNLDGGSSTSLYYQGKVHYGKLDSEGNRVQRPIKSVLVVQ